MKKQYLTGEWILEGEKTGTLKGNVPGCVHTDLMANGIIKDIYYRDNKKQYDWIENEDFTYVKVFDAEDVGAAELVFLGLDTYSTVYLNGERIGESSNMFHPYRFDISGKLLKGRNELKVAFRSPIREVMGKPLPAGAFTRERMHTRRIQCTYGWDWVDRFVTEGIYRPVYIEYGNDCAAESAYIVTENIDRFSAGIRVELDFKNYDSGSLCEVSILSPSGEVVASAENYVREPKLVLRFDIEDPKLWYPQGYGEQPLYTLRAVTGENVFEESFGIRTVKILQLVDKVGSDYEIRSKALREGEIGKIKDRNEISSGFQLIVNGKRILAVGANWVPSEPFPSAETEERFNTLIDLSKKMGVNMIRVWGGGIFEDSRFYDACDKAGIMVCQDFLMACGTYPEKDPEFIAHLRREAEYAAKLLRNHPSLMWWHGDNENAVNGSDDMEDHTGRDSARRGLAPAIYSLDPERQFLPSSPWGGKLNASLTRGTTHNTNYIIVSFNYFMKDSCEEYRKYLEQFTARFISEEPTFGAVSRRTARRFLSEEDMTDPEEIMLRFHTKTNPALKPEIFYMITAFAKKIFGEPENSIDRYFFYEYVQYEWVRVVFENLKRNIGFSNGLIYWMLNDCWPASLGWAFIDYYAMPKAAYYAFRRLASHVTASVTEKDGKYLLYVTNANEEQTSVKATVTEIENGAKISESELSLDVSPYSASVGEISVPYSRNKVIVADVVGYGVSDRAVFFDGKPLLECKRDAVKLEFIGEGTVRVFANEYVHAVYLEGDALFSDNLFSLLPGETRDISYTVLQGATDSEITYTAYTLKKNRY